MVNWWLEVEYQSIIEKVLLQCHADHDESQIKISDRYCFLWHSTSKLNHMTRSMESGPLTQVCHFLISRQFPVTDPLLLRKSGSAGNRIRSSGSVFRNSDLCATEVVDIVIIQLKIPRVFGSWTDCHFLRLWFRFLWEEC
jgi:hypothetical protein